MKIVVTFTMALFFVACGTGRTGDEPSGEGEGETAGEGEGEGPDTTTPIAGYVETAHVAMRQNFATEEDRINAETAANGTFRGGNHTAASQQNMRAGLQAFISGGLDVIAEQRDVGPIDNEAVRTLFEQKRASDLQFFSDYYGSAPWLTQDRATAAAAEARSGVNSEYSAVIP